MRLFIAADIPDEIRKKLVFAREKIGDGSARIKWVEEENLHITLKFLGDVSDEKAAAVKGALSRLKFSAFGASVVGIGAFPGPQRPRIIWAGIRPENDIRALKHSIDNALEDAGFQADMNFHPHVTLGRVRAVASRKELTESLAELRKATFGEPFRVSRFILSNSVLTPNGPVYTDISSFRLGTA